MRHRYVPKPDWKVSYTITYFDCKWDEIALMGAYRLDAFALTGKVYEFTRLWADLERGKPVEIASSELPVAFTVEVCIGEEETERETELQRLCSGYIKGRDSGSP